MGDSKVTPVKLSVLSSRVWRHKSSLHLISTIPYVMSHKRGMQSIFLCRRRSHTYQELCSEVVKEFIEQLAAAASESKQIIGDGSGHAMWRVIKDWAEAQSALIEANQVKIEQVFLPYA